MEGEMLYQGKTYRTKIDRWLLVVIIGAFASSLLILLFVNVFVGIPIVRWVTVLVLLAWGSVLSLIVPVSYQITASTLLVQSGWLRNRIPLASIQRVFPTRNPLSGGPALSLDRLQIEYLQGDVLRSVLISPQDKAGFVRDLAEQAGDFQVEGDQWASRKKETGKSE